MRHTAWDTWDGKVQTKCGAGMKKQEFYRLDKSQIESSTFCLRCDNLKVEG